MLSQNDNPVKSTQLGWVHILHSTGLHTGLCFLPSGLESTNKHIKGKGENRCVVQGPTTSGS